MRKNSILAFAGLLCAGLLPLPAEAAAVLDATFGNGGRVVTSFPGGLDAANGVAVQTDGKIVVAGSSGSDFALTRYNTDGSLDASFGTGGRVHSGQGDSANAIVIQPDGKIVLAGSATDPGTLNLIFALVRFNTDGSLDGTFGTGGRVVTPFPGSSAAEARAIARQLDGKLVVAGSSTDSITSNSVFALARYNTNGSLDTSFDGDGLVTTDFAGVTPEGANAVALQATGKIVAAGQAGSSFAVARYNSDGSLDNSFDGDGKVTTAFGGSFEEANAIAIQADGQIIVAGHTDLSVASEDNFALARYNSVDGSLDTTFDTDGKVTTDFGLIDTAEAVVIQPDGRIVAVGRAGTTAAGTFFALARYNTNGSLDNAFDGDGKVLTDFSGGRFGPGALGAALQTDGRVVAVGAANISGQRDFGVARYNTNGSLDASFGTGGQVITDFPLNQETITGLVIQPDGKIIAAGRFNFPIYVIEAQDPNFELARYNTDGSLDLTFGTGGLVSTDFPINDEDFANAVALQADGRIVVAGQTGPFFSVDFGDTAFGIVRYNTDGSLDTSFGTGGRVTTDFGTTHDSAAAVAVQADGKIVVAGTNGIAFALARYNSNGSLDTSGFGIGGKVTTDFGGGFVRASAIVIQPDGRIVAAGSAGNNFALARYNSDGGLDTSGFGSGGKVTTDFNGGFDGIAGLVSQPDGKLVATGRATNPGTGSDFALARYNTDGGLDPNFGSGGKVTTDFGGFDSAGGLALQSDGRLVAAGLFFPVPAVAGGPSAFFALARYDSNGNIDTTFGAGGKVTTDFFGINNQASAIALQTDGRIVIGGFADTGSSSDFALARYTFLPSPTPTPTPTPTPGVTPTPTPVGTPTPGPTPPTKAINLSTRMRVQTGDNVGIGGFIITGSAPKHVLLRAIGPSLTQFGLANNLADPVLELHGPGAFATITNDNWRTTQEAEIQATGMPPPNDFESAIVTTLAPGAYTAIVSGNGNTSGVALVEVYDLNQAADSKLANLSTRAFVSTGSDIVIAGFLLSGSNANDRIVVRGIGPSLAPGSFPASAVLANPTLELRDSNGTLLISNNDWQDNAAQAAEITAAGLAPTNDLEAGIAATLPPGVYTALLAGLNNGTGIGLVEVYDLGAP